MRDLGAGSRRVRARFGILAVVLGLGVLAAACAPGAPPAPGCPTSPPDAITSTVFNRTNADRGGSGLGPLSWNAQLACLADEWSRVMRDEGTLRHRDLGATIRSPGFESYASLAENIIVGPGSMDGNAIHNAWMNSPSHRANILGHFDSIGIGIARGGDGRLWATQNFGRRF